MDTENTSDKVVADEKPPVTDDAAQGTEANAAPLPEVTVEHLSSEISRLTDKVFEINPDVTIGGADNGGAVDVACAMLDSQALLIMELEDALAKAKASEDNSTAKIAKLEAALANQVTVDPEPAIEIKRPKVGAELKMRKKRVDANEVLDAMRNGDVFQVVLADANSNVLDLPVIVGGAPSTFLPTSGVETEGQEPQIILITPIDIEDSAPSVALREGWLLDVAGVPVSKCRLSVDLPGGGGLTARIPEKSLVFRFGE